MKSYFCFVHVRPDAVPELRALACDDDDLMPVALQGALQEWPHPYRVEVMEGGRILLNLSGAEIAAARDAVASPA